MTKANSAWGSLRSTAAPAPAVQSTTWTPDQPWQSTYAPAATGQFPAPGTPQWFGAGPAAPVPAVAVPVNTKTLVESVSLPYLIVLGLGVLLTPLSFFCLALAIGLVSLMRYRRRAARWLIGGAWLFAIVLYLFGQLTGFDYGLDVALQVACLGALVGGPILQYLALRAGERPDRTY